jgi:hypothetical protein
MNPLRADCAHTAGGAVRDKRYAAGASKKAEPCKHTSRSTTGLSLPQRAYR